jgi:ribosomal-protein-alanine acetyltransferase
MHPSLHIRPARHDDLDAIEAIENRVFETDRLSRRSIRHFIEGDTASLLVAERGGKVAGYALVAFRSGSTLARLYSLAVSPEAAGGGLGRDLLAAVEAQATARGSSVLRLEVRAANVAAIRLYERKGFRRFGIHREYYEDGADALRYEKRLSDAPGEPEEF